MLDHMLELLQRLPFKYHWFLVVLMAFIIPFLTRHTEKPGEFYPFSNFPMYSRFEPKTYYVYVRGLKGEQVSAAGVFSTSISNVKKVYDGNVTDLKKAMGKGAKKSDLTTEDLQKAATKTLRWLVGIAPEKSKSQLEALRGLELHKVDIEYRGSLIEKKDSIVGSLSFPIPSVKP